MTIKFDSPCESVLKSSKFLLKWKLGMRELNAMKGGRLSMVFLISSFLIENSKVIRKCKGCRRLRDFSKQQPSCQTSHVLKNCFLSCVGCNSKYVKGKMNNTHPSLPCALEAVSHPQTIRSPQRQCPAEMKHSLRTLKCLRSC